MYFTKQLTFKNQYFLSFDLPSFKKNNKNNHSRKYLYYFH